jgi:hypothetical protein
MSGIHDRPPTGCPKRIIQGYGYDRKIVEAICPYIFNEGATVYCNNYRDVFEIENHGGIWSINAK